MNKRKVECLCGSCRFSSKFRETNLAHTLAGNIVLTIGAEIGSDEKTFAGKSKAELRDIKAKLDLLHMAKIDLCDEICVINEQGYIGDSTAREIAYAKEIGKPVLYQWWTDGHENNNPSYGHRIFEPLGCVQHLSLWPWVDGEKPADESSK